MKTVLSENESISPALEQLALPQALEMEPARPAGDFLETLAEDLAQADITADAYSILETTYDAPDQPASGQTGSERPHPAQEIEGTPAVGAASDLPSASNFSGSSPEKLLSSAAFSRMLDTSGRLNPLVGQALARLENIVGDFILDREPRARDSYDQAQADWRRRRGLNGGPSPDKEDFLPRYEPAYFHQKGLAVPESHRNPEGRGDTLPRALCGRAISQAWGTLQQPGNDESWLRLLIDGTADQLGQWLQAEEIPTGAAGPGPDGRLPALQPVTPTGLAGVILRRFLTPGPLSGRPDYPAASGPYNELALVTEVFDRLETPEAKEVLLAGLKQRYPWRFRDLNPEVFYDASEMQKRHGPLAGGRLSAAWSLDKQLEVYQALKAGAGRANTEAKWRDLAEDPGSLVYLNLLEAAEFDQRDDLKSLILMSRESSGLARSDPEFYDRASAAMDDIPSLKAIKQLEDRLGPDPLGQAFKDIYLANMKRNYDRLQETGPGRVGSAAERHLLPEIMNSAYLTVDTPELVGIFPADEGYSAEALEKGAAWLAANRRGLRFYGRPGRQVIDILPDHGRALTKNGREMSCEAADLARVGLAVMAVDKARAEAEEMSSAWAEPGPAERAAREERLGEAQAERDRLTAELEGKFGQILGSEYEKKLTQEDKTLALADRREARAELDWTSEVLKAARGEVATEGGWAGLFEKAAREKSSDGALALATACQAQRNIPENGRGLFGLKDELNRELGLDPEAPPEEQAVEWLKAYEQMRFIYTNDDLALLAMTRGRAAADQAWAELRASWRPQSLDHIQALLAKIGIQADRLRQARPSLDQRPEAPGRVVRFEDLPQYDELYQAFPAMAGRGLADAWRLAADYSPGAEARLDMLHQSTAPPDFTRRLSYLEARAEGLALAVEDFGDQTTLPYWKAEELDKFNRRDEKFGQEIVRTRESAAKTVAEVLVPTVVDPLNFLGPGGRLLKAGAQGARWAGRGLGSIGRAGVRGMEKAAGELGRVGPGTMRWLAEAWDMRPDLKGSLFRNYFNRVPAGRQAAWLSEKYEALPRSLQKEFLSEAPHGPLSPEARQALIESRLAALSEAEAQEVLGRVFGALPPEELARFQFVDDLAANLKPGQAREFFERLPASGRRELLAGLYSKLPAEAQKKVLAQSFDHLPLELKKQFAAGNPAELTLAEWEEALVSRLNRLSPEGREKWLRDNLTRSPEAEQVAWVTEHLASLGPEDRRSLATAGLDKALPLGRSPGFFSPENLAFTEEMRGMIQAHKLEEFKRATQAGGAADEMAEAAGQTAKGAEGAAGGRAGLKAKAPDEEVAPNQTKLDDQGNFKHNETGPGKDASGGEASKNSRATPGQFRHKKKHGVVRTDFDKALLPDNIHQDIIRVDKVIKLRTQDEMDHISTSRQEDLKRLVAGKANEIFWVSGKPLKPLPNKGRAIIFSHQSFKEVFQFWRELTGSSITPGFFQKDEKFLLTMKTKKGDFTLRNFASSTEKTGEVWTLVVPEEVTGKSSVTEFKFLMKKEGKNDY